ncbi:MAG: hypothetical protein LQ342_003749 [Letrouitia transgressa]|nr:MAG: hypothetical protein LQ342_003749 [Letrouitia transgressa]
MRLIILSVNLSLVAVALSAPLYWGFSQQGGTTKLIGSSFGVLGKDATYDYVIVGGGTSGLTVAKRLAEDPKVSVAVVEAGGFYGLDNGNVSQIPAYHTVNSNADPDPANIQPLIDWGIITPPQDGLNGRKLHFSQGKCLGGSGTIGSYNRWADIVGDDSFTFDNILPFFKKSVQFTPPNQSKLGPGVTVPYDPSAFGQGGPLRVSYSNFYQPISPFVNKAFAALGLKSIHGFNSGKLIGYSHITDAIDPQAETRSSAETSFLAAAIEQSALQVYKQTLAKRIVFSGKRASGVQVQTVGVRYALTARKEVIVAAGAFRTPQLLMVSGVGPQASLSKLGVHTISDLKGVGQNLWDQPNFGLLYPVNVSTFSSFGNPSFLNEANDNFLKRQEGPLTNPGGDIIGWEKLPTKYYSSLSKTVRADLAEFPNDWPDLELLPSVFGPPDPEDNFAVFLITLLTTTSRGSVTLNSIDTEDNPVVDPKYLDTETDKQVAVQAYKRVLELVKASGYTTGPQPPPPTSDAQILDLVKNGTAPFYHATGTCKMGKQSDANAVVDPNGKVFGVQGLRVVDASIFPLTPPGHIMATICERTFYNLSSNLEVTDLFFSPKKDMLAEKIADNIKNGE